MASILIVGEDPDLIDFDAPDAPPDMTAQKVHDGLDGSRDRLRADGHEAEILLTRDAETVDRQFADAVRERRYDIIVIGAGLRTLPKMADQFELLVNAVRRELPQARIAFNSNPADSDKAARRWLDRD